METKHTSFMFQGAQGSDSYFWKMHFKEYGFKFNLGGSLIHSSLSK